MCSRTRECIQATSQHIQEWLKDIKFPYKGPIQFNILQELLELQLMVIQIKLVIQSKTKELASLSTSSQVNINHSMFSEIQSRELILKFKCLNQLNQFLNTLSTKFTNHNTDKNLLFQFKN